MREGLAMYPALFLYPWDLASLAWMKDSGYQIPLDIPVVCLNKFSHPNQIEGNHCPFAIDGERYYFTKQVPRDASGNRSQRNAGMLGAFWKSTSKDIEIIDLDEKLIGYMRKYTLCEDKVDKRSANWLMEEYRVHDKVNNYVLCKIYDKDSQCPKYTDTSIRALRKRFIERQLGSHLDQTNSLIDNRNQSQTQFDGCDSHEDIISTSHDASGNQNLLEPIPSNPWSTNPMNQSQTQSDNNNFVEDHIMQPTFRTFENSLSDSICHTSPLYSYSNEYPYMLDGISNFGNLNAVDEEESSLDCFSLLWHH